MTCEDCKTTDGVYEHGSIVTGEFTRVCADCQRTRTRLALEELIRTADDIILHAENTKQAALDLQFQILIENEAKR